MQNLREKLFSEWQIPEINGERCVHAHIETASCKACVDVCPENAWILNDESLGLNTEACDGCGLCVPACSEGAILQTQNITIREDKTNKQYAQKVLLLGCEKTNLDEANCKCIHSLSYTDLLKLTKDGIHQINVSTADCKQCTRGKGETLFERIAKINKMLKHSHLPMLHCSELAVEQWQQLCKTPAKSPSGPDMTRRLFFQSAIKQTVDIVMHQSSVDNAKEFMPLGEILPIKDQEDRIYPAFPMIKKEQCTGCDACLRACPHEVLTVESQDSQAEYQIKAKACTACGICEDICEEEAISIQQWSQQTQAVIPLKTKQCQSCGIGYHYPENNRDKYGLCLICRQVNHQKNLFQVME